MFNFWLRHKIMENKPNLLQIKFFGNDYLAAKLLSKELDYLIDLIHEATKSLNISDDIIINVDTPKKGSFELSVFLQTVVEYSPQLFNAINKGKQIIDFINDCINLKQHLKGDKPKQLIDSTNNTTEVENQNGETKAYPREVTNNYFNNCHIDSYITGMSNIASQYNRGHMSISNGNDKITEITPEDIHMKNTIPFEYKIGHSKEERELFIRTPDLLGKKQWGFRDSEKDFNATIEDYDFIDTVLKGIHLYAGCKIRCTVYSEYQLDYYNMPISGTAKYKIIKVHGGVIEPMKQSKMF